MAKKITVNLDDGLHKKLVNAGLDNGNMSLQAIMVLAAEELLKSGVGLSGSSNPPDPVPAKDLGQTSDLGKPDLIIGGTIEPRDDPRLTQVIALFAGALAEAQKIAGVSHGPTVPSAAERIEADIDAASQRLEKLHEGIGDATGRERDDTGGSPDRERRAG